MLFSFEKYRLIDLKKNDQRTSSGNITCKTVMSNEYCCASL
jgi:hypothetical protein